MTKVEIQETLQHSHTRFSKKVNDLSDSDFLRTMNGKWTAGQQLDHIIKSVSPVNQAFVLPTMLLRVLFGKANRASRSYDALVEKYKQKLAAGYKAPSSFVPKSIAVVDRKGLTSRLQTVINSLTTRVDSFSEEQLDMFILPHPLLGKITLREMLYFTIYHVEHHEKQVEENLINTNVQL